MGDIYPAAPWVVFIHVHYCSVLNKSAYLFSDSLIQNHNKMLVMFTKYKYSHLRRLVVISTGRLSQTNSLCRPVYFLALSLLCLLCLDGFMTTEDGISNTTAIVNLKGPIDVMISPLMLETLQR